MSTETTTVTIGEATTVVVTVNTGPRGPSGDAAGGLSDGDKGDITVSGSGTTWTIGAGAVDATKVAADVATQAELDTEATTRAAADTALDGRLDTIEGDYVQAADIASLQSTTEKGAADGYAGLDATGVVPDGQLPAGLARDSELTAAITAALNGVLDGAPAALDTLNELAASIGDDADFAGTVTAALAGKQAASAELSILAGLTSTTLGRTLLQLASSAAGRTALGVVIGTDVQAWSSTLDTLAALTTTTIGRNLLTAADAAAARTLLSVYSTSQVDTAISNATSAAAIVGEFTGTPDGTQYLRDDGTLATPEGGGVGVALPVSKPSGADRNFTVGLPLTGSVTVVAVAANQVYYQPFRVDTETSYDQLAIEITTGVTSAVGSMAVYEADGDWQPGAQRALSAELDCSTTGVKTATIDLTLEAGIYLLAFTSNAAVSTRVFSVAPLGVVFGSANQPRTWIKARTYAALPDPGVHWDNQQLSNTGFQSRVALRPF